MVEPMKGPPTADQLSSEWLVVTLPSPPRFAYFKKSGIMGLTGEDSDEFRQILVSGLGWVNVLERNEYLKPMLGIPY